MLSSSHSFTNVTLKKFLYRPNEDHEFFGRAILKMAYWDSIDYARRGEKRVGTWDFLSGPVNFFGEPNSSGHLSLRSCPLS